MAVSVTNWGKAHRKPGIVAVKVKLFVTALTQFAWSVAVTVRVCMPSRSNKGFTPLPLIIRPSNVTVKLVKPANGSVAVYGMVAQRVYSGGVAKGKVTVGGVRSILRVVSLLPVLIQLNFDDIIRLVHAQNIAHKPIYYCLFRRCDNLKTFFVVQFLCCR